MSITTDKPKLEVWSKTFTQESDTCSSESIQSIIIEQHDGGGGPFWRLATQEWAFSSISDFSALLRDAGVPEDIS